MNLEQNPTDLTQNWWSSSITKGGIPSNSSGSARRPSYNLIFGFCFDYWFGNFQGVSFFWPPRRIWKTALQVFWCATKGLVQCSRVSGWDSRSSARGGSNHAVLPQTTTAVISSTNSSVAISTVSCQFDYAFPVCHLTDGQWQEIYRTTYCRKTKWPRSNPSDRKKLRIGHQVIVFKLSLGVTDPRLL